MAKLIGSAIATATGEALQGKLVPLINKIIHMIPEEIHIPHTTMYLMGGFQSQLRVKEDSYMHLPLHFSLQSEKAFFPDT
jgi:hypothetical protein